jgi:ketosteroid isomerase-like protein
MKPEEEAIATVEEATEAEATVMTLEDRLRDAMVRSDVDALQTLLDASLVFTDQTGRVFGKEEDLQAHRSGLLRLTTVHLLARKIIAKPTFAIVSAQVRLVGTFGGTPFEGEFRYTRTWCPDAGGTWRVIAGHVSAIPVADQNGSGAWGLFDGT